MSGRRSLSDRLRRVREWQATRDDGSCALPPFDVKAALTGVPEDHAVRGLAFTFGQDSEEYRAAVETRGWLVVFRRSPPGGAATIGHWRDRVEAVGLPRALYARAADAVAQSLRDEVHGELSGLGSRLGRDGRDARKAAGYARELAREWEAVAAVCRERIGTVDLDRLPGGTTPKD